MPLLGSGTTPGNGSSLDTREVSLQPIEHETLSPEGFLETLDDRREQIESSRFVPPKLGDDHFGYVEVDYKQPVFKPVPRT